MWGNRLTRKQERFVNEYLVDLNGTQAAIRAGYSKKSAGVIANELLKKPKIEGKIDARRAEIQQKLEISQERVLGEEKRLAFCDPRDIMTPEGTLIRPNELPEDVARALSGVEVIETFDNEGRPVTRFKYKFWDKGRALERISKHLGMYIDRKEVSGGDRPVEFIFVGEEDED